VGFKRSEADSSMFNKISIQGIIIILIYVNDLVITGSDPIGIKNFKSHLGEEFDIKELGELKYFLSIEITLSQRIIFFPNKVCFGLT
jgi:Reverse transcriptase (RNA-dependent DNA polymerase)